jgi:hypothetical protein
MINVKIFMDPNRRMMEMKKLIVLSLFFTLRVAALTLDAKNGKSEFTAIGRPAAIQIKGLGAGPTGTLGLARKDGVWRLHGEATLDLESFTTGIDRRDQHMKEKYLETGKMKTASLSFIDAEVPATVLETGGDVELSGILKLHGVEKSLPVQVAFHPGPGGSIETVSQFKILVSDYAMGIPTFAGITMADQVMIKIETQVAKAQLSEAGSEKK